MARGACSPQPRWGLQMQQRQFSALGDGADYLLPTTTKNRAAFGFAEAPLAEAVRLQFGARVENVHIDGTTGEDVDVSRGFTPVSGSVGLVYDIAAPWRLGLALSSGRARAGADRNCSRMVRMMAPALTKPAMRRWAWSAPTHWS